MTKTLFRNYEKLSSQLIIAMAVTLLYFLTGRTALLLATVADNVAPVWFPSGIGIASVLIFGRPGIIGVILGAFITNWTLGTPFTALLGITFGNTAESICGAYILRSYNSSDRASQLSGVLKLCIASCIGAIISSFTGVSSLYLAQIIPLEKVRYAIFTWWSGDAIGAVLCVPLIIKLFNPNTSWKIPRTQIAQFITSSILLIAISAFTFIYYGNMSVLWGLCPVIFWLSCRYSKGYTLITTLLLSFLAIALVRNGYGHFQYGDKNLNILYLQLLLFSYSIATLLPSPEYSELLRQPNFMRAFIGIWVIVTVFLFTQLKSEQKSLLSNFEKTIDGAMAQAHATFRNYEVLLLQGAALAKVHPHLTAQNWKSIAETLDLKNNFKAVNGFGLVYKIENSERQLFLKKAENNFGLIDLKIRDLDDKYAATFTDSFIITFVEPFENNKPARGLNLGSEPIRREGAELSRSLNKVVASKPIKLIQDSSSRPGFLIYNPVTIVDPNNRVLFDGWAYSPVIFEIFFKEAFGFFNELLSISFNLEGETVFEDKNALVNFNTNNPYVHEKIINFYNRQSTIRFYPTVQFFAYHKGIGHTLSFLTCMILLIICTFFLELGMISSNLEKAVELKTKEVELNQMKLAESAKLSSLGEMASGIAHEINNPLAIISGKAEIIGIHLKKNGIENESISKELKNIQTVTYRIAKIVKALKTFSRSADQDPKETVNIRSIVDETLELCRERFKNHDIELKINLNATGNILCRPTQITQVLTNLLNNSYDAISQFDKKWIEINLEETKGNFVLSVTDSGNGIPESNRNKLMQPFFTTKPVGKGTGLGLSISKGIIEDHGGRFYLDTTSPNTKFVVELSKVTGEKQDTPKVA